MADTIIDNDPESEEQVEEVNVLEWVVTLVIACVFIFLFVKFLFF